MRSTAHTIAQHFVSLALLVTGAAANASAKQGVITTVAGGNIPNNIPATAANIDGPTRVATDNSGNLYIAARGAYLVFKVNATGVLTIVAGNGTNGSCTNGDPANLGVPGGVLSDCAYRKLHSSVFNPM